MRIGIDLMGSDRSPLVLFEAVFEFAASLCKPVELVLFLTQEIATSLSVRFRSDFLQGSHQIPLDFCLAEESISMDEDPLSAIRIKKKSSLIIGIKQLASKQIDAFITAGNTGALIGAASINLKPLENYNPPALLAVLPTKKLPLALIDAGGNISAKAENYVHYAHLGAAYQRIIFGIPCPRVGLLNIGSEFKKGSIEHQKAYSKLLEQAALPNPKILFVGNVEPQEVYAGKVDVLVSDGFTGNIFLKTSEAMASYIFDQMAYKMESQISESIKNWQKELQAHFDYEARPGALLCGVEGLVIKCHGSGSVTAMQQSINEAISLLQRDWLSKICKEI